jgi:hypothetical protein
MFGILIQQEPNVESMGVVLLNQSSKLFGLLDGFGLPLH